MKDDSDRAHSPDGGKSNARFTPTHWTLVNDAKRQGLEAEQALVQLCGKYWYPLYAFARRHGHSPHDAEDLTQGFFEHLFKREWLASVSPEHKGRFRTFLIVCFKRFWANQRRKEPGKQTLISLDAQNAEDRFALEPADGQDPAQFYEFQWAETLISTVLNRLHDEYAGNDELKHFEALRPHLTKEAEHGAYAQTAQALGITEGAARVAATRLRHRFAKLFREEVAATVLDPHEVDQEIRHLQSLWSR